MKASWLLIIALILSMSWVEHVIADDAGALFIQKCGACHRNNKKIKTFTPSRYTSAQWRRFFDKNKHRRKKDISQLITSEEISDIKMYLISHSKDSAEPDVVGFSQDKYVWKAGTLVPKYMGWAKLYREIILPVFTMVTNGNITVKIYWGDVIGDDRSIIQKLETGELDIGGISGYGTSMICPEMSVLNLPFLFRTRGEFDYVISKMRHRFEKLMDKRGYVLLLMTEQDFDQIYTRSSRITHLEHFKGVLFGSWYGELEKAVLSRLSAKISCPESSNVSMYKLILKQSTVEAFIAPAIFVLTANMYTSVKYVHQIKIRYAIGTVVLRKEAWNKISPYYHERMNGYFQEYVEREFSEAVRRHNKRSINAMINYGIEDVKIPQQALDEIIKATRPIWFDFADKLYPKEILNELLHHLQEYRSLKRDQ
jgi:TRAP-type C4-dicarboxylate transport system substrate-binding protein